MYIGGIVNIPTYDYNFIAKANGYAIGECHNAPKHYAVFDLLNGGASYFNDREEAEWDFCARAFEWFEDNMYIHMIENGEEASETHSIFDHQTVKEQPLTDDLIGGLKQIRADLSGAAQLVDEMCAEVDRLRKERHNDNNNNKRI